MEVLGRCDAGVPTAAGSRASAAGVHKVDEQLCVLDLGISTRSFRVTSETPAVDAKAETSKGGALWFLHAQTYRAMLAARTFRTQAGIAKDQGFSVAAMSQIMALLRLHDSLQSEVITVPVWVVPWLDYHDCGCLR